MASGTLEFSPEICLDENPSTTGGDWRRLMLGALLHIDSLLITQ